MTKCDVGEGVKIIDFSGETHFLNDPQSIKNIQNCELKFKDIAVCKYLLKISKILFILLTNEVFTSFGKI